jgi:uncharacterized membrane protein YgcG
MNPKYLLLAVAIAGLASCKTAYKSQQTPDDVYYSPERKVETYVRNEEEREQYEEEEDNTSYEDRSIRMKIRDYRRWSTLDNDYYYDAWRNDPWRWNNNWNNNFYYDSPWYSYSYFNPRYNYYSGNCCCYTNPRNPRVIVYNPVVNTPRKGNLGGYNGSYNNTNGNWNKGGNTRTVTRPANNTRYNNNNNNNNGGLLRRIISPSGNSNSNSGGSNEQPVRTYNSGGNNSGGSSGSGGGTVTRPARRGG